MYFIGWLFIDDITSNENIRSCKFKCRNINLRSPMSMVWGALTGNYNQITGQDDRRNLKDVLEIK